MSTPQEPMESIRERAKRALRDNEEARLQAQLIAAEVRAQVEGGRPEPARPLAESPFRRDPAITPDSPFRRDPAVVADLFRREPAMTEGPYRTPGDTHLQPEPVAAPPALQAEPGVARGEDPVLLVEVSRPEVPVCQPALPAEEVEAPVKKADAPALQAPEQEASPQTLARDEAPSLLERRMQAIHVVRELQPRRSCFRERVQELQGRLSLTPTDSIHYAQLLQRLAEVHAELNRLEGRMEEAQHTIRSTEWLMEMLTDPTRSRGRKAGEELETVAR